MSFLSFVASQNSQQMADVLTKCVAAMKTIQPTADLTAFAIANQTEGIHPPYQLAQLCQRVASLLLLVFLPSLFLFLDCCDVYFICCVLFFSFCISVTRSGCSFEQQLVAVCAGLADLRHHRHSTHRDARPELATAGAACCRCWWW
jgi:hypothetical protein